MKNSHLLFLLFRFADRFSNTRWNRYFQLNLSLGGAINFVALLNNTDSKRQHRIIPSQHYRSDLVPEE